MSSAWERSLDTDDDIAGKQWYESSSDDSDIEAYTADEAADCLIAFVLNMKDTGAISAKSACVIFWWAGKAGLSRVAKWGFRPDAPSSHFQRHLDMLLGCKVKRQERYCMNLPSYQKHARGRQIRRAPVQLPHEVLDNEARTDPLFMDTLLRAVDGGELPPVHSGRAADGSIASPVAVYADGVEFQKRDSLLGLWVCNVLSGIRYVCIVLRRTWFCRCGCRGWCSIFAALDVLRWSLEQASSGVYPTRGYYDEVLTGVRLAQAGSAMTCKFVLQYIKGDWAEFAHTFGLPSWKTLLSPCCFCLCTTAEWLSLDDISDRVDAEAPWQPLTARDYDDACSLCEKVVTIHGQEEHNLCLARLFYDKRSDGGRGRCLKADIPSLALKAGDRLEPSPSLPDVASFDGKRVYPFTVTFWRRAAETAARHRLPLFCIPGVGPDALCIDMLHCVFLGIAQAYLSTVFWRVMVSNPWRISATTIESFDSMACQRLHYDIMDFYASRRRIQHRPEGTTELVDLSVSMLGSRTDAIFKAKGAETKSLIPFAIALLDKRGASCSPGAVEHLHNAGVALMEVMRIQSENSAALPKQAAIDMYRFGVQHCRAAFLGGVRPYPKHHAFVHMLRDAFVKGNPKSYACWEDEGLNKVIAGVASKAYPTVWEHRVIEHMNMLRSRNAQHI